MSDIEFTPVLSLRSIVLVEKLASEIWQEHYIPIIGKAQVEYMLEKFQSRKAIAGQISEGCLYYLINAGRKGSVGYMALEPKNKELYLSKFYIKSGFRGLGYGRKAVEFMIKVAADKGLAKISLSVNKNNLGSIAAYKKFGFAIAAKSVRDIGDSFIMDDFKMEMRL